MSYDNTNTFIFSRNERKTEDKHPDFTGSINVDGVEYFMDAWIKERKDGTGKFFSGKVKRKDKQPSRAEKFEAEVKDRWPGAQKVDDQVPW